MTDQDIQGKVTDIDGNPVIGVPVYLVNQDNVNQVLRTTTDSNGDFIFNSHPDAQTSSDRYHVISGGYNSENILVSSSSNPQVTADLREDPFFDVSITSTNSPIKAGNNLDVDYSLNNTGGKPDTQDIRLEINGTQEDQDSSVSLNAGTSTSGVLTWNTQSNDEGDYNASVLSDDDSQTVGIVIESPVPETAQSQDLVAWYRFEDGDARDYTSDLGIGDTTDYTGSVRSNSTYQSAGGVNDFENGFDSGSYRFFGNNSNSGIDLGPITLSSHTKMIWFKLDSLSSDDPVFGGNGGGSERYTLISAENGTLSYVFDDGNTSFDRIIETNITNGEWYHACITYDSSSSSENCEMYINGNLIGTATKGTNIDVMGDTSEVIGYFAAQTSSIIDGVVDDARIYDRALASSEISDIYQATKPEGFIDAVAYDDLKAWYRFEDGNATDYTNALSIGDTTDYSGTVNGASYLSDGGVTDFEKGNNSGAFEFFGGVEHIEIPTSPFDWSNKSISMWFKLNGSSGDQFAFGGRSGDQVFFYPSSDKYGFEDDGNFGAVSYQDNIGEWTHVVFQNDGSTIELYVNGNLIGTDSWPGPVTTTPNMAIGANNDIQNAGGVKDSIDGIIDDVRIYDRSLSSDEVSSIYNKTKP